MLVALLAPLALHMPMHGGYTTRSGVVRMQSGTRNPLRLAVLKLGATEPAFSSPLNGEVRDGEYLCAGCSATVFDSTGKYTCPCGWPSFWKTAGDVKYKKEWDGRVEASCNSCNGHLGHVFSDGPAVQADNVVPESDPKCGQRHPRYCINGASLTFKAREDNVAGSLADDN